MPDLVAVVRPVDTLLEGARKEMEFFERQRNGQGSPGAVEVEYQAEDRRDDRELLLEFADDARVQAEQFGLWPSGSVGELVQALRDQCGWACPPVRARRADGIR